MINLKSQFEKIRNAGIVCIGNSLEEIVHKERIQHIRLPSIHKEFLTICGENLGHLFCGCNIETRKWDYINETGRKCYKTAIGKKCPEELFFMLK